MVCEKVRFTPFSRNRCTSLKPSLKNVWKLLYHCLDDLGSIKLRWRAFTEGTRFYGLAAWLAFIVAPGSPRAMSCNCCTVTAQLLLLRLYWLEYRYKCPKRCHAVYGPNLLRKRCHAVHWRWIKYVFANLVCMCTYLSVYTVLNPSRHSAKSVLYIVLVAFVCKI